MDKPRNPCPQLSPHVAQTLDALRADGVFPTDAEIAWLVLLRLPCDCPEFGAMRPLLGAPVQVAGETFWPLHARARRWFLHAWEVCDEKLSTAIYLYAHSRSAPGDRSLELEQTASGIERVVTEWRSALPLHDEHEDELIAQLRKLDGHTDAVVDPTAKPAEAEDAQSELGWVAAMCKMFPSTTPEYWQSGISEAEISELLSVTDGKPWATCRRRNESVANYLRAVKWVRFNHAQ